MVHSRNQKKKLKKKTNFKNFGFVWISQELPTPTQNFSIFKTSIKILKSLSIPEVIKK